MSSLNSLIKRNLKIFFRTKGNIIFASLSVLILIALHFLIFRKMYTDNWEEIIKEFQGFSIEREKLVWLVDSLMFSAIIPIGAITVSFVALGLIVADKEKNVLSDFLVSPIKRNTLFASYLISSFAVGFLILTGLIAFFDVFFAAVYGVWFTLPQLFYIFIVTAASLIFSNSFILLIVSFFKTQQALGAAGTIIGTLSGFMCGAYIPVGMFGETVGNILSAMPFLQLTVLARQAFLYEMESVTNLTREMISGEVSRGFGIDLWFGTNNIPVWLILLMTGVTTLIFLVFLTIRFVKLNNAE